MSRLRAPLSSANLPIYFSSGMDYRWARPEATTVCVFRAEPYIANDPEKVASALNAAGNIRNEAAVLTR